MEPFKTVTSRAVPFDRSNVDTDIIIPAEYLKLSTKLGFGAFAFKALRFLEDGKTPNPESVFNQPEYQGAEILLAGDNFGCGSSREQAAWGIKDMGFRCIIAPSFADIFYSNCFKNGIVTVKLPKEVVAQLMEDAKTSEISVDLENQVVQRPNQERIPFDYEPFKKHALLNGLDEIGMTLQNAGAIDTFEAQQKTKLPWQYGAA